MPLRARLAALLAAAILAGSGCGPDADRSAAGSTSAPAASSGLPNAAEDVPDEWETFTAEAPAILFRYPRELGTAYIQPVDWPPSPAVQPGPLECVAAGDETARAGRTEPTTVDGRTYCVTRVTEGAAGSIYTLYAYAMPIGDDVVILTFSVRAVQCGNYDEPSRSECERERADFSMDPLIDRIARTMRVDYAPPGP